MTAPARAFFMGLVDGTPQNMLVHPDVNGRVTLQLKQVTVEEALDAVRDLYGYDYRRVSTGYWYCLRRCRRACSISTISI